MAESRNFPNLFSPMQVKNITFKNRIFTAPTHSPICFDRSGMLTREGLQYYGNFAKGGAAAVHTGEVILDRRNSLAHDDHLDMTQTATLQMTNSLNAYAHAFDAKTSVELCHSGIFANPAFGDGSLPFGPVDMQLPNGQAVKAMTEDDMVYVAGIYAKAANMAKRCGFDMICVQMGMSWLLGSFLSPFTNTRTDAYGKDWAGRIKFPRMVLQSIRDAVGDKMLIECRMSGDELLDGGIRIEDTIEYVKRIENLIDLVHITAGSRLSPSSRPINISSHFVPEGHLFDLSEQVKRAGVSIPVGTIGGISDPALAEAAIAEGKADYVLIGRSFIADDGWAEKARKGKTEEIRPCIRCYRCSDIASGRNEASRLRVHPIIGELDEMTRRSECSVNPLYGNAQIKRSIPKPEKRCHVVVVGGGPAGMRAALTAADRGHRVTLYEKDLQLGGKLAYADYVWFKKQIRKYRDYLIRALESSAVEVKLNTQATPDLIYEAAPDAVIIAVGAEPWVPPIPGTDSDNVKLAMDAICGISGEIGIHVSVIGGGLVGCETALHFASLGRQVTLIETTDTLASDGISTERHHTLDLIAENESIRCLLQTTCEEISGNGVKVRDKTGQVREVLADTVILATGYRVNKAARDRFASLTKDVYFAGDCKEVGTIYSATVTGFDAALRIGLGFDQ